MEKHKRIYWKIGLNITPEIFIKADNYHIAERCILTQSYAFRTYGILPDTSFKISYRLNHDTIFIDELYCRAITNNGHLIDVQNDVTFKELSLHNLSYERQHYVILSVDSFQPKTVEKEEKEEIYATATYNVEIIEAGEMITSGIPIMKIYYNRKKRCMEEDKSYIVPHISLSTSKSLIEKYHEAKDVIEDIINKLSPDEGIFFHVELLEVELKNYTLQEFPAEMILLLKKFCTLLKSYLKKLNRDEFDEMQSFLDEIYNHNDILCVVQKGLECLKIINLKIDEKEETVEEIIEMPAPAPKLILPEI